MNTGTNPMKSSSSKIKIILHISLFCKSSLLYDLTNVFTIEFYIAHALMQCRVSSSLNLTHPKHLRLNFTNNASSFQLHPLSFKTNLFIAIFLCTTTHDQKTLSVMKNGSKRYSFWFYILFVFIIHFLISKQFLRRETNQFYNIQTWNYIFLQRFFNLL